ncbi:MAG: autotransporter-associated beta strand repeat-containing protein, partial [Opitutae bacterium]
MKRFDPHVGGAGQGLSAGKSHRSLKTLLRNAATITLFATGAYHQTQTVKATDWSYDFANSVYSMTSSTAIPNNTNTTWNSAAEPTGAPTIYTRSSTSSNPLGYGIQVVNGGDTNLGSGGELNLFGGITASGTFFSLNDWTASKYYDVRFSAVLQGSGTGAYAQVSIGDGASFAGNSALTAGQIAAGLKFTFGASNAITTTWNPATGTTFGTTNGVVTTTGITSNGSATAGTVLNIRIVGNNDTTTQTYSISGVNYTVAPNKYDIFLNGVLIGDDISALLTGANVDSLNFSLFGAASSTSALKLDNITVSNSLTAALVLGNFWNGGSGTWTSTSPNWSTSAALGGAGMSDSSSTNALVFGGIAGTVAVSGTVTVPAGMNFTTTGYTLSGGTINLSGTTPAANTITIDGTSSTASISSVLTGTNGLIKAGTGSLNLSGANTYSGTTTVSAGTLQLGSGTALGTSTVSITAGAALDLAGVTMVNANALTVNGTGISSNGVLINSSTNAASYKGAITLGSDSTITAGTGNISLTGG